MDCRSHGFREIAHTADWALKVWAENLESLLVTALQGMYTLMEVEIEGVAPLETQIELSALDPESLLVSFLSEVLYLSEIHRAVYDVASIHLDGLDLKAALVGKPVHSQRKEIKAVTYHHLRIDRTDTGLETTIVFDV